MRINSNYAYIPRFKGRVDEALIQRLYWHRDNYLKNISDPKEIETINKNISVFIDNLKESMENHHKDTILEYEESKNRQADDLYFTHILLQNPQFKIKHFLIQIFHTDFKKIILDPRFCEIVKDENIDANWLFGTITYELKTMCNKIGFREIVNNTKQYLEDIYMAGKLKADVYAELKSEINKTISEL